MSNRFHGGGDDGGGDGGGGDGGGGDGGGPLEPTVVEIGDVLDLHPFLPREVAGLVRDYIDECVTRGFVQVRLIHGKGIGNLRRTVHAVLDRHPDVIEYELAGESGGGWGATIATLRRR